MVIAYGLMAAAGWGAADFLARFATRRIGTYRTLLFMQFVGLIVLTPVVLATGELRHIASQNSWHPWAWAILTISLEVVSSIALYRSFEIGVLSLVSPIAASFAAIAVVLSFLSGESVTGRRGAGIVLALAGVLLASYSPSGSRKDVDESQGRYLPPGVAWALAAALGLGVSVWLLGFKVTPRLGGTIPVWLYRLVAPPLMILIARPLAQGITLPPRDAWRLIIPIGLLDTGAFVAASTGLRMHEVAIVSILLSLFSAVTVLLAWIFLREQLRQSQWFGIATIFAGVVLVSA